MEYHKGDIVRAEDCPPPGVENVCTILAVPGDLTPQNIDGQEWRYPDTPDLKSTLGTSSYVLMDKMGRCRLYRSSLIDLIERVDYRRELLEMKEELGV